MHLSVNAMRSAVDGLAGALKFLPPCQNFLAHMRIIVNRGTVDARNDSAALVSTQKVQIEKKKKPTGGYRQLGIFFSALTGLTSFAKIGSR
jgi:hypothetical protein